VEYPLDQRREAHFSTARLGQRLNAGVERRRHGQVSADNFEPFQFSRKARRECSPGLVRAQIEPLGRGHEPAGRIGLSHAIRQSAPEVIKRRSGGERLGQPHDRTARQIIAQALRGGIEIGQQKLDPRKRQAAFQVLNDALLLPVFGLAFRYCFLNRPAGGLQASERKGTHGQKR
jgi:hypothetical protein